MKKYQSGQALLIVLLVMAVGLTISLAVISRSITDIRISQQEEESARAFSVAEAGIEESLRAGSATPVTIGGITATVTEIAQGGGTEFDFGGNKFGEGDIQTVWLVEHNAAGEPDPTAGSYGGSTVDLYWGNEGEPADQATTPALEVSVIYEEGGTFKVLRGAFDPYAARDNGFDAATSGSCSVGGKTYQFCKTDFDLPTVGTPYALRLKLLYSSGENHPLCVSSGGSDTFPSQGKCFESAATVLESGITRKVQQCQFHKAPPGIFDYVLFSEGDLSK